MPIKTQRCAAAARELVGSALKCINDELGPLCAEARALCEALASATDEECVELVKRWRGMACRNGSLVEFSKVLSHCTQWNTAPYLIGTGEGARAAMYYLAKVRLLPPQPTAHTYPPRAVCTPSVL